MVTLGTNSPPHTSEPKKKAVDGSSKTFKALSLEVS